MRKRIHSRFLLVAVLACTASGQPPKPPAAEVLEFERKMEAAVVRGDVAYVDSVSASDLSFTHGDGWTTGGQPLSVDDRKGFLKRVENKTYLVRDLDSVKVEMHGDIAITYGRYIAENRVADPAKGAWFSVWFERVYAKRGPLGVYFQIGVFQCPYPLPCPEVWLGSAGLNGDGRIGFLTAGYP
jgi:hypothetical protein